MSPPRDPVFHAFFGFAGSQGHLPLPAGFWISVPFRASLLPHARFSLHRIPSSPLIYLVRAQFLGDEQSVTRSQLRFIFLELPVHTGHLSVTFITLYFSYVFTRDASLLKIKSPDCASYGVLCSASPGGQIMFSSSLAEEKAHY